MPWKEILRYVIGAIVGLLLSDFVIKTGPGDFGFIEAKPGFGLDDVVVGIVIALTIWIVGKFV